MSHVDEFSDDHACAGWELLDGMGARQLLSAEQQIVRVADGLR